MKNVFVLLVLTLSGISVSGCSESAQAQSEPKKLEITCQTKRSDVKWFWGEICPIDQNGYVSVGNSISNGVKTTGCVTLQNVCSVVSP